MSYRVLVRGDSGQTIIGDSNPCTRIVTPGAYDTQTTGGIIVNYPSAVQPPYEPYVYFRPNDPHQIYLFRHVGSPGNWTGFAFWQSIYRDVDPPVYGGKWKASAVMLPETGGWGMQVFDTQSRVMSDSNQGIVRYLGGAQVWSKYTYNPNWPDGLALQTWYLPFPYGTEACFQVSYLNVSAFIIAETPCIGFLENSVSLIFVSSIVQTETSQQFNRPFIVVA